MDATHFETLPGVAEAIRVSKPYKLITRDLKAEKTVVRVGRAAGADGLIIEVHEQPERALRWRTST